MSESLIFAIDFDGTLVKHAFPAMGEEVPYAFLTLQELQEDGHRLILYTMRSGKYLDEAVRYCRERKIRFWGLNKNPEQHLWTESPKVFAHFYIDDAMLGAPLIYPEGERPYLDWKAVRGVLKKKLETVQILVLPEELAGANQK